ncbi:hypothetical protein NA56DRAFT_698422 [Hyaloscypha hepaticicola]|uniref:Uncharacterized protein n=1 Tax=Hyaloscypha hepaticicola TaxID=2082293 RepID=A0A2J6QJ18_9HELO|nr:hypothetical protein NA56DRAFT_698422 [Hyaloscypha hepaticicola]
MADCGLCAWVDRELDWGPLLGAGAEAPWWRSFVLTEWLLVAPHFESGWKRVCPKGRSKHAASGATFTARAAAAAAAVGAAGAEMPQSLLPALPDASPLLQRRGMASASTTMVTGDGEHAQGCDTRRAHVRDGLPNGLGIPTAKSDSVLAGS